MSTESEPPSNDLLYFCDESSQVGDDFMAVAGLAIRRSRVPNIVRDLAAINASCGVISEVKWSTAKTRRVSVHKQYADYLFKLLRDRQAHFHIRFAPFNDYNHRDSGPRKRVDTVSKMYYQLLLHRAVGFYGKHCKLYVHPDNGDCTAYLPMMRNQLCAAGFTQKRAKPDCVKAIEPRDSAREPLLQLLDVTLGALTARRNGRELGPAKSELADHVVALSAWPKLDVSTAKDLRPFNVWNVIPSRSR